MTINLTKSPITRSVTDGRITQQRLTTEWPGEGCRVTWEES